MTQIHHLEQWKGTVDARYRLADILIRLTTATLPIGAIKRLRFLSGTATQLSGWDGLVDSGNGNAYLPEGKSVWELGVGANDLAKIRSDFTKRSKDPELPDGWDAAETTYVAVTLAKLQDAAKQATDLAEDESPWKSVRILDVVELYHWLGLSDAVDVWAYEVITTTSMEGMQSLSGAWGMWSSVTEPAIQALLVTTAREAGFQSLQESLSRNSDISPINADSPDEAVAFIYAAIQGLDELKKEELGSRALVISSTEAVKCISRQSPLLFVLKGDASSHAMQLLREGHQVVSVHGRNAHSVKQGLKLERQPRQEFAKALVEMGVPEETADIDARACGSSASVWRVWNLYNHANADAFLPAWINEKYLPVVVPVVLLGGWDTKKDLDVQVVEAVSGISHADLRDKLDEIHNLADPFIEIIADTIVVSAPATAFALIVRSIGSGILDRFTEQARTVFQTLDPNVEEGSEEQMYAPFPGDQMHSEWLRDGMAGTLLRISVLGRKLEESGRLNGRSCQQFVNDFVRGVPGLKEDTRLLASLRDQLPVLAEAAPVPFMEALEALLQGHRNELASLFADTSEYGGALHPSILWALETIAWEPSWLARAVLILGALDDLDPGGRLSNRPAASIVSILLPWYAGTSATSKQKVDSLNALIDSYPVGGWGVLLNLLPGKQSFTSGTRRPEWRETRYGDGARIPRKEVAQLYSSYVECAIVRAASDVDRLASLVDSYPNFTATHRRKLEGAIQECITSMKDRDPLSPLWEALRKLIGHHRQFPDAAWVLDNDSLKRLEELSNECEPSGSIARHLWLFSDSMPDIPFSRSDSDAYYNEVAILRKNAINELWSGGKGLEALHELINRCKFPGIVAMTFAAVENSFEILINVYAGACVGSENEEIFSAVLSAEGYEMFKDQWTTNVLKVSDSCSNPIASKVTALRAYPDSLALFDTLQALGPEVESDFWRRHRGFTSIDSQEVVRRVVRSLTKYHRARDAVAIVAHELKAFGSEEALDILDATLNELNEGLQPSGTSSIGFWIAQVFEKLRKNPESDRLRVAKMEYRYLPLLVRGLEKKDLFLHEMLATEPSFFVDVLCDLYTPASGELDDARPIEERRTRARHAWQLLHSWRLAPGMLPDGSLDADALNRWIVEVRQRAEEADRVKVADQQIGQILYHTPEDPEDGVWPHVAVRRQLETLHSEQIESGIHTEQFNSRGVTTRSPYDGGEQERDLANLWRQRAETVGARWPRTQALLLRVADSWEHHAKREDEDAEKNRLRDR
ncbi:hypothetical protein [Oleiagrimonas soli]|uniref:Uncharacterized protein n=1 Tax=Oleiagrimonas soli TaxID=1543381 RepID=A0A841KRG8_9GAMM|nr:hypothetical protein [Oleiagrimonas soli]MBB6185251.1 hypothetical protein [Oleiagrimonas soli]